MLMSLKVENFILSAILDLLETWTKVFGFEPLEDSDKEEMKNINMMMFPGTSKIHIQTRNEKIHSERTICGSGHVCQGQCRS
jgi:hypothetical protein